MFWLVLEAHEGVSAIYSFAVTRVGIERLPDSGVTAEYG
jgi:hypothetical protein